MKNLGKAKAGRNLLEAIELGNDSKLRVMLSEAISIML